MREKAIDRLIEAQRNRPSHSGSWRTLSSGDYFHNGTHVLDDVLQWHDVLRNSLRKTDTITSAVLDLVDRMMLTDVSTRIDAESLCTELVEILHQCQAQPRESIPKSILDNFLEVDNEAVSHRALLNPPLPITTTIATNLEIPTSR